MDKNPTKQMIDADQRGNRYLIAFAELEERGLADTPKAQKLFKKAEFWIDRYNKLAGLK